MIPVLNQAKIPQRNKSDFVRIVFIPSSLSLCNHILIDTYPRSRQTGEECVHNVRSERIANETPGTGSIRSKAVLCLFRIHFHNISAKVDCVRHAFEQRCVHEELVRFRFFGHEHN